MNSNKLSISLMCADPCRLMDDIKILESENVDYLHIDVMDGHFVPNLGLGLDYILKIREYTKLPFDYHLMVDNPDKILPRLDLQENDLVSIHFETAYKFDKIINHIKNKNIKLFMAIKPELPISILNFFKQDIDGINFMTVTPGFSGQNIKDSSIEKMRSLTEYIKKNNINNFNIEVDGNMNIENIKKFKSMGANIFVLGTSSIYKDNILNIKELTNIKNIISE